MSKFRVIPVLDILKGTAVHAIMGFRNEYKPVKSILAKSSNFSDIIDSFNEFGFQELYIADLDSIINHEYDIDRLKFIIKYSKMEIMIDAGIRNLHDLNVIKDIGFSKIILGLETIESLEMIKECVQVIGNQSTIISVDMKNKQLITTNKEISNLGMMGFIDVLNEMKINQIILLDIAKVGSKSGCYDELYGEIRETYPNFSILIGGGARNIKDILILQEKKMNGVLIASALHDGSIKKEEIKNLFFS